MSGSGLLNQTYYEQKNNCTDSCHDNRTEETACRYTEKAEDNPTQDGTDNTDNNIDDYAEPSTLDDDSGKPSDQRADCQEDQ